MSLSQEKIDLLTEFGEEFGTPLCLPPFNCSYNVFYCIEDIKGDCVSLRNFMIKIKSAEVFHKFVKVKGKDFVEIMWDDNE